MNIVKQIVLLKILFILASCNVKHNRQPHYIDTDLPRTTPKLFAHNFISKDSVSEYGSVFNKAVNEFYFAVDTAGKSDIRYSYLENGKWSQPKVIIQDAEYSFNDPFLSPDENKLYYISDMPRNKMDTINDIDIWYSEINEGSYSKPINAGSKINTDANEYYISFTNNGSMYFSSNKENYPDRKHDFDIYKSEFKDNEFKEPKKLGEAINSKRYEADVFIAPDESYIIYCSARKTGLGRGDLYFSYKDKNNEWTQAVNMGEPINSEGHEICPFVTQDGKYLFYTSNQNIYWVSTDILNLIKERTVSNTKSEKTN